MLPLFLTAYILYFTFIAGPYRVDVNYDGVPVKNSPFLVEAYIPPDAGKVRAYGPGLKSGKVGSLAPFTIDTTDAGKHFCSHVTASQS